MSQRLDSHANGHFPALPRAVVRNTRIDPATRYYRDRLALPWVYQVVADGGRDFVQDGVRCLPAAQFLAALV